ncbi:MAG: hypothetical protein DRH49_06945 [Candidatus Coatesbacteria bacterium]|nr:MAG: hypothetical protein DRH49_06945 [Candidatus Coatesbacteria bacterium]
MKLTTLVTVVVIIATMIVTATILILNVGKRNIAIRATIDEVLSNPEAYNNKLVVLEGTLVLHPLEKGFGTAIFLENSKGNRIEVFGKHPDPSLIGKHVEVEGIVTISSDKQVRIFLNRVSEVKSY